MFILFQGRKIPLKTIFFFSILTPFVALFQLNSTVGLYQHKAAKMKSELNINHF